MAKMAMQTILKPSCITLRIHYTASRIYRMESILLDPHESSPEVLWNDDLKLDVQFNRLIISSLPFRKFSSEITFLDK